MLIYTGYVFCKNPCNVVISFLTLLVFATLATDPGYVSTPKVSKSSITSTALDE